jgi:hypothetical protein
MKKALIVLLLAGIAAGGAFAQISFSGEAYMGIQYRNPGSATNPNEAITTEPREPGGTRLDLTVTVGQENYGARLVTRSTPGSILVRGMYGWVDFDSLASANDSLRLSMGQFADGIWIIRLDADLPELMGDTRITGFRLTYNTPIQGLSLGTAFRATGHDFQSFGEQIVLGGTFVTPHFSTVFVYDLGFNVSSLFGLNFPSFGFIGLHDLSFGFKAQALNMAHWGTRWDDPSTAEGWMGLLRMYQRLGYRIGRSVDVSLIASQYLSDNPDNDYIEMMFGPGLTYRFLPNLVGSLRAMIDSPDHFSTQNLRIRPSLGHTLRGPALFYVQYELLLPDIGSSNPMNRAVHTVGFGLEIRAF